ncbi:MAG: hypothetical protein ACRC6U_10400 [Fusobacteriaceae bacterium]
MPKYIKKYNETGVCEVDLPLVVKEWDSPRWTIQQWRDEFRLHKKDLRSKTRWLLKVEISEKDAKYLIKKLNLVKIKSSIFRNAFTWKSKKLKF